MILQLLWAGDIRIHGGRCKIDFRVDIVKSWEHARDNIDEDSKAELNGLKVLDVFKDDNLKSWLNCIT